MAKFPFWNQNLPMLQNMELWDHEVWCCSRTYVYVLGSLWPLVSWVHSTCNWEAISMWISQFVFPPLRTYEVAFSFTMTCFTPKSNTWMWLYRCCLKPYSHGTSITWGPQVIYKLPHHICVSCSAFAQDKRSLCFNSKLLTLSPGSIAWEPLLEQHNGSIWIFLI